MKNWFYFICISGLIFAGCGTNQHKSGHDNYYQGLEFKEELSSTSPAARQHSLPQAPSLAKKESAISVIPSAVAGPSAGPNPAPKPDATTMTSPLPDRKRKQHESTKKPSVPVHQQQERQKRLSLSELVVKYPQVFKVRGSSKEKKVALTFDDGPDVLFTPQILDVLKQNHAKATFFVVGNRVRSNPGVLRRIVNEGHAVGNHSFNHANMPKLSEDKFRQQIENTQSIIKSVIGYAPKIIRPPYGAINEEQVKWISSHQYVIVNWNVDTLDWKQLNAEQVLGNVMKQTRPGSIILQHSAGGDGQDLSGTVRALPEIISKLRAGGYELVTVPELLHMSNSR